MKYLDPTWLSLPIRPKDVFNMALKHVYLRFEGFEGSYGVFHSHSPTCTLKDRDQEELREVIRRYIAAIIELGKQLETHNDFTLS